MGKHFPHLPRFDNLSAAHHGDPARNLAHNCEVVRDEQHGQPVLALKLFQQRQYLRLHRNVECSGRLVGNQQLRPVDERHRNQNALPLTAGKLVRIVAVAPRCIGDDGRRQTRQPAGQYS
jgi:hypothetical protein